MTLVNVQPFIVVAWLALNACTTIRVADNFRGGQPVTDATIANIVSDPEAWEGKWVRVSGVASSTGQRLYTVETAATYPAEENVTPGTEDSELYLDPAKADPNDERTYDRDPPGSAKRASGQVSLTCWRYWKPFFDIVEEAAKHDQIILLHPHPPREIGFCNFVSGPYLEHAVTEPTISERVP